MSELIVETWNGNEWIRMEPIMVDPKTLARRDTGPKKLKHITEECAELIQAIAKAETFGMYDCYDNGEINLDAIKREIADVRLAMHRWEEYLKNTAPQTIESDFPR